MAYPIPCEHDSKKRCHECKKALDRQRKRAEYLNDPQKRIDRTQAWRDKNPGKRAEYERRHRADHAEKHNEYHKQWRRERSPEAKERTKIKLREWRRRDHAANPQKYREHNRRQYGIVWAPGQTEQTLIQQQNWLCVCGRDLKTLSGRQVHVDHDHSIVGRPNVRGILCHRCNMGLGLLSDRPDLLVALSKYLMNPPGLQPDLSNQAAEPVSQPDP